MTGFPRSSAELIKNTSTVSPTTAATVEDALDILSAASPGSVLTTLGDLLSYNSGPVRVAVGAANTFLGSTGAAVPSWRTAAQVRTSLDLEVGSFTPTVALATPGTSSFTYAVQIGRYLRLSTGYVFSVNCAFTPTIGTGSGTVRFSIPITSTTALSGWCQLETSTFTWPASRTMVGMQISGSVAYGQVGCFGSAVAVTALQASDLTDGASHTIRYGGYIV